VNLHGEQRSNETHLAPHKPQARLAHKGKGQAARLERQEITDSP
jgi:hypothetical protein